MIYGAHVVIFSTDADADRAFLGDVLGLEHVDAGGGWLIFAVPPAEAAVHPAEAPGSELYLMCEDPSVRCGRWQRRVFSSQMLRKLAGDQ